MQLLRVQQGLFVACSKQTTTRITATSLSSTSLRFSKRTHTLPSTVCIKASYTTMAPEQPRPRNKLQEFFPNVKLPVIISPPMLAVSNGHLAAQVSKAGGFGLVPGGYDMTPGSAQLRSADEELGRAREALGLADMTLTPAPVGVGFVTCHESAARFRETALPILERHLPQAVWLFAPDPAAGQRAHPGIIEALHDRGIKVFVQVGTVAAAREAAADGADIIVAQGADAGGHQFAAGAGVISLVPEVRAMLDEEFAGKDIALVAAGGIADANAVVAAIALGESLPCWSLDWNVHLSVTNELLLGADGVVMGTKVSLPARAGFFEPETMWMAMI